FGGSSLVQGSFATLCRHLPNMVDVQPQQSQLLFFYCQNREFRQGRFQNSLGHVHSVLVVQRFLIPFARYFKLAVNDRPALSPFRGGAKGSAPECVKGGSWESVVRMQRLFPDWRRVLILLKILKISNCRRRSEKPQKKQSF